MCGAEPKTEYHAASRRPLRRTRIATPSWSRTAMDPLSNSEIADRLAALAQLLSTQKENPYTVRASHRAAARIRTISASLDELVRDDSDLTLYSGIGDAIASAIREIVTTGTLAKLEKLRAEASPALAAMSHHPKLDP